MAARDPENPSLGGGEKVLWEFSRALSREGHHVEYLCSTFPGSRREAWIDGVHVLRLGPEALLGPAAFLAYRRWFRGRIDIVLEDILGGSWIPFFAPTYVREPLIGVWYQDHLPLFKNQFPSPMVPALAGLERSLVRAHHRTPVLVPSRAAKDDLVKKGANPERVEVYYPGVPPELLEAGIPPGVRGREPRVLWLGKIRRYKCPHHAILAFSEIAEGLPEATLTIAGRVGDRRYLREFSALIRRLGLEGRVAIELNIGEDRKASLLRSSRAFVAPAPVEGFGIAVAEASACGLPVVGSQGVPGDALQEGVNGFRVPFGDISAIAKGVRLLLTDDSLFDALSRSAHGFARQFTWEAAVQPLLRLVHEVGQGRQT